MIDLSVRSREAEWMDEAGADVADFGRCLADLEMVNRVTFAHRPVLRWLALATRNRPSFTLLDVGYGNGDLLRAIAKWAARTGKRAALTGIDLNPASEAAARAATPPGLGIVFRTADVFEIGDRETFDFVVTSLMTHHLGDEALVAFLGWIDRAARIGWFNHDLHRHVVAYYGFRALGWAAQWHRMVRHDGAVSVAKGFRRADWLDLLERAGVHAEIRWRMPFKLCLQRLR